MSGTSFWSSSSKSKPRVRKHLWLTILLGVVGAGLPILYTVGDYEDSLLGALFVVWIPLWMTWWHGWRWGLAYLVVILGLVVARKLCSRQVVGQVVGWLFVAVILAGLAGSIIAYLRTPADER